MGNSVRVTRYQLWFIAMAAFLLAVLFAFMNFRPHSPKNVTVTPKKSSGDATTIPKPVTRQMAMGIANEWAGPEIVEWAEDVEVRQVQVNPDLNPDDLEKLPDGSMSGEIKPGAGTDPWLIEFIGVKKDTGRRYIFYLLIDSRNGEIIHVGIAGDNR